MKHQVSIKEIRTLIKDADLNITASKSGAGSITVHSDEPAHIPVFAVMCRMRNIYMDVLKTGNGKYYGSITTKFKMNQEAK